MPWVSERGSVGADALVHHCVFAFELSEGNLARTRQGSGGLVLEGA